MIQNYITIALRNLSKHRTYAMLNTLGLSLSIACCILIFMVVRHHFSFDKFHQNKERIVMITTESRGESTNKGNSVPYPMGAALRQEYAFLEKTAMVASRENSLITLEKSGEAPVKFKEENTRAFAESAFFDIFDFPLLHGSMERFEEPKTALLTERIAQKYYGKDDPIGKTFKVNNSMEFQVVGVLKDIPENTDLQYEIYCSWATIAADTNSRGMLNNWGGIHGGTQCFTALREGHTAAELETAFTGFKDKYFHPRVRDFFYHAVPLTTVHFDPDYGTGTNKKYIWTLAMIGLFLLLTACVNFVNMATAQALNRAREVGVRKAMGGTRSQIFWQFMSETGMIVAFSTVLGLILAKITLPALNTLIETRLTMDFGRDLMLYGFLGVLMIVVVFFAGAYPGLALSGFRPSESLKGALDGRQAGGFTLRRLLVGTQFAISQVLIIGAIVVTAQMQYARNADLGFRKEGIVTVPLPGKNDPTKFNSLKQQLSSVPGIEKISLCMQPPAANNNWNTGVKLEGRTEDEKWTINFKFLDDQYLETFDLKLVAGRNVLPSDTVKEYIVNEEAVKRFNMVSPEEIIGKKLYIDGVPYPVVGVVKNFHNYSFHRAIQPQVMATDVTNFDVCAIRLNLKDAKPALASIERIWTSIYPEFYFERDFMDERIAKFYSQETIIMQLVRAFAGIAIFIGCLGLYGLAAFMVARKRKEIGIRKTLGASIVGILWLFGKEYARLIVLAFLVAVPLGYWAMSAWLNEYTFHISMGVGIFGLALVLTFMVAIVTAGAQSLRAALANPVKSLRSE
jgi:putative ABC transport system permease protein